MGQISGSPQFKIKPPRRVELTIQRPRLCEALTLAASSHRLILVEAPAGYGKSTVLSDWVRSTAMPSAWLTLDRFDARPERLLRGVLAAVQLTAAGLSPAINDVLLAADRAQAQDEVASYDHLLAALDLLEEPLALVIDDVHLAGPGLVDGVVGVLTSSAPPALRLVLSGRDHSSLRLEKLRYADGLEEFRTAELAFTLPEAVELASSLEPSPELDVEAVWSTTAGWPVALHAGLVGTPANKDREGGPGGFMPERAFTEYIAEEVLGQLDPPLADFVLRATTSDWLEHELAIALSGLPTGGALLQECIRKGLFIEEQDSLGNESVYRWQPLFAAQCREILEERNRVLAEHLHLVAARYYQDSDISESVSQALSGREPQQAVNALAAHWLEYLLRNGLSPLEQLCLDMPSPWSHHAGVLMIRSICRALAGDAQSAADLAQRAFAGLSTVDIAPRRRFERFVDLLGLLPNDGTFEVYTKSGRSTEVSQRTPDHLTAFGAGRRLLGPHDAHQQGEEQLTLSAAPSEDAADRSHSAVADEVILTSEIALAYAVAGDFIAADERAVDALHGADELGWSPDGQMPCLWLAQGITSYWSDDLAGARTYLDKVRPPEGRTSSIHKLGAVYRVLVDCAGSDADQIADTRQMLASVQERGLYGPSWNALSTMASAKIAEAEGDLEGALELVKPLERSENPPLVDAFLAETLRRSGRFAEALNCTKAVTERERNSYTGTSIALTEALLASRDGDMAAAHERVEHAVSLAEPQRIIRPFAERRGELAGLLMQHAVWGTAHEAFVAAQLKENTHSDNLTTFLYWRLTERELEVLAYMRSMMTAADIGKALFISVNTVKTHQRSIYRKLGAASRRDVLKIAATRGII
ncbi:LuxR C-terminal-related transcriptional regulator [Arthrobacter sp. NPDC089319]|uniref:helix-turn-helix transcriptional regulator n=1 Tax=Arthrobacter sp. NPDC089319 TaxID=3155915 RepID=UPI003433E2F6